MASTETVELDLSKVPHLEERIKLKPLFDELAKLEQEEDVALKPFQDRIDQEDEAWAKKFQELEEQEAEAIQPLRVARDKAAEPFQAKRELVDGKIDAMATELGVEVSGLICKACGWPILADEEIGWDEDGNAILACFAPDDPEGELEDESADAVPA